MCALNIWLLNFTSLLNSSRKWAESIFGMLMLNLLIFFFLISLVLCRFKQRKHVLCLTMSSATIGPHSVECDYKCNILCVLLQWILGFVCFFFFTKEPIKLLHVENFHFYHVCASASLMKNWWEKYLSKNLRIFFTTWIWCIEEEKTEVNKPQSQTLRYMHWIGWYIWKINNCVLCENMSETTSNFYTI